MNRILTSKQFKCQASHFQVGLRAENNGCFPNREAMMTDPHIADNKPAVITLEPGTYAWCQCGLSQKQPFCDGSHKGSGFVPIRFTLTEAKRVALCNCKHSSNAPYCDGSHARLAAPEAG